MPVIECPANYFGRGENYVLPEDQNVIAEIEQKWKEWEEAHPEDPLGEIALADAKRAANLSSPVELHRNVGAVKPKEESENEDADYIETTKLQLELPPRYILLLKNYAKFRRRRPRDILMGWIDQYAKL